MNSKPLILLSNDDGFGAPGLLALEAALQNLGSVAVSAPDRERSGSSRGISLSEPLRIHHHGELRWSTTGTPSDAVYLALYKLLPRRPDLVVSGINPAPNLACDVHYSGTVAAALEGAMAGIPSLAVSQMGAEGGFEAAASLACQMAQRLLSWGEPLLLNLNVPQEPLGLRWVHLGRRDYHHSVIERQGPRGRSYYWVGGRLGSKPCPGADIETVASGWASLTPIRLNQTDDDALARLRAREERDAEAEQ